MDGDALRSGKTVAQYRARRADPEPMVLLDLPLVSKGVYWRIVENQFPYDKIAVVHHLIVPERDFSEEFHMNRLEKLELDTLKDGFARGSTYDCIMMSFPHNRSIPQQFHYHLIKFINLTKY